MSNNTPIVNFDSYNYSVGIGAYGLDYEEVCDDPKNCVSQDVETSIQFSKIGSLIKVYGQLITRKNKLYIQNEI
jgi:hypothetical protein